MATLKDVKNKIGAVKKTRQITKAMNMVATSKLRNAQQNMERFRPYAAKFAEVLGSLAEKSGEESNPLFLPRDEVRKVHVLLCTSDKGLCGGFNSNLAHKARRFQQDCEERGVDLSITAFGKKGRDWVRKAKQTLTAEYLGVIGARVEFSLASNVGRNLVEAFLEGTYDEVYVIYSEFVSVGRQVPAIRQILPIPPLVVAEQTEADADQPYMAEHICEPSPDELLGDLLPRNVYVQLFSALLETSASEHAARMTAMDNATKACNDMIDSLTLTYNKARQAAITSDLMDIVGGAEALRG